MRALRLSLLLAFTPALAVAQATPAAPATPRTHARAWPDTSLRVERGADRAQATFSLDSARAIALRTVAGGRIQSSELEQEHGKLIYSFDVKVPGKRGIEEVNIDAKTGALVGREHENEEDERPAAKPAPAPAHP